LTQESLWPQEFDEPSPFSSTLPTSVIKRVEIKTTGAYEVTALSAENHTTLSDWLASNRFVLAKENQMWLEDFLKRGWHVVAIRVNPSGTGLMLNPAQISVELSPLIISFTSQKCVFPLPISTSHSDRFASAVFVLSTEPLLSRAMFEQNFLAYRQAQSEWLSQRPDREKAWYASTNRAQAGPQIIELSRPGQLGPFEEPSDPRPPPEVMVSLLRGNPSPLAPFSEFDDDFVSVEGLPTAKKTDATSLPACARQLPRLTGKSWWVTKQTATFSSGHGHDVEFEPAIAVFADKLHTPEGRTLAHSLPQFGAFAVPVVLAGLAGYEPSERRLAAAAIAQMADPRVVAPLARLLQDPDPRIRASACSAAVTNWDSAFAPRVVELLSDPDPYVSSAAAGCLHAHPAESANYIGVYRKLAERGGPEAVFAIHLLWNHGVHLPTSSLVPLLASGEYCTVHTALFDLRDRRLSLDEISTLLTNSLTSVRLQGLTALLQRGDIPAMDRIVSMLRDPDEALRWTVRTNLRRLSGKKLGADPAAWEKWWNENRKTFSPVPAVRPPPAER
jgi:hypothetical protein